jgi:hypothetical protein
MLLILDTCIVILQITSGRKYSVSAKCCHGMALSSQGSEATRDAGRLSRSVSEASRNYEGIISQLNGPFLCSFF